MQKQLSGFVLQGPIIEAWAPQAVREALLLLYAGVILGLCYLVGFHRLLGGGGRGEGAGDALLLESREKLYLNF